MQATDEKFNFDEEINMLENIFTDYDQLLNSDDLKNSKFMYY